MGIVRSNDVEEAEENVLPWIPRQQAIDDAPPAANNLGGDVDDGVDERPELHAKQLVTLLFMTFFPPR